MMDLCWPHYSNLTADQKESWEYVMAGLEENIVFQQLINLQVAWKAILLSMLSAFVLCIIYIYLMAFFANILAWAIIFLTQIAFIALTAASLYYWSTINENSSQLAKDRKTIALVSGICFGIISLLFALALWCGW